MAKIKVRKDKNSPSKVELVPKRRNRLLAIVMKRNKNTVWKWVRFNQDSFTLHNNTYFVIPEGTYISKNKILFAIYMEGVSTPISHIDVHTKYETRNYYDPDTGEQKTAKVAVVNNLKFDSEIVDILLNRHLADEFTKSSIDGLSIILIFGIFIACACSAGSLMMWFI